MAEKGYHHTSWDEGIALRNVFPLGIINRIGRKQTKQKFVQWNLKYHNTWQVQLDRYVERVEELETLRRAFCWLNIPIKESDILASKISMEEGEGKDGLTACLRVGMV